MERKIKFKAKKLSDGSWVEGDLERLSNNRTGIHYLNKLMEGVEVDVTHVVDPSTVCQYTGLKDKDGKEVWEHDIVECTYINYPYNLVTVPGIITYMRTGFYLRPTGKNTGKYIMYERDQLHIPKSEYLKVLCSKFDKEV